MSYFQFNNKLNFLEKLSFSVQGELDPDGRMPPGDNYAVSPIQLSYTYSTSAVYSAQLVPVSLKFTSPGKVLSACLKRYMYISRLKKGRCKTSFTGVHLHKNCMLHSPIITGKGHD